MKQIIKLLLIIVFIILILVGSIIFFDFKINKQKQQSEEQITTDVITINDYGIDVLYIDSNKIDESIAYGNVFEKQIEVENKNDASVIFAIEIAELETSNELLTASVLIKDSNAEKYETIVNNKILENNKLAYNIIINAKQKLYIKIQFKANLESEESLLKGYLKIVNNLSLKEVFIENMHLIQNSLIEAISALNGINEAGFYVIEISKLTSKNFDGYILIDARNISELKYIYTVYDDNYMIYNTSYSNIKTKNITEKDDAKVNKLDLNKVCSLYTKKKCQSFDDLKYVDHGGKANFVENVKLTISKIQKVFNNTEKLVYIYDVESILESTNNIKGYILINNQKDNPEYYLYLTNNLFMISGYNYTKLGDFDENSATVRAYNESSFNLSSKDLKTVCNFTGFKECYDKTGTLIK